MVISGHQWSSVVISGPQSGISPTIDWTIPHELKRPVKPSVVISGHQWSSVVLRLTIDWTIPHELKRPVKPPPMSRSEKWKPQEVPTSKALRAHLWERSGRRVEHLHARRRPCERRGAHSMARWKALPDLASEPTWNETPIMSSPMSNAWLMSVSYSSGFAPVGTGGGGRRGEHLHAARTHPDSHHL